MSPRAKPDGSDRLRTPSRRRVIAFLSLTCLASAVTPGCGRDQPIGPPTINAGRDLCAECGMIISEEKFAAAMVVEGDGQRESLLFDDIGDMLDHEKTRTGLAILARYVHDFDSRQWLDATTATYLASDSVRTPMGSGIIAFSDRSVAEQRKREFTGIIHDYGSVSRARQDRKR